MTLGETFMKMMMRVLMMAIFVVFITPMVVAPALGVSPSEYTSNQTLWAVFSLVAGWAVAWPVTKLIKSSIKKG